MNWVVPAVYQYSGTGSYTDGMKLAAQSLEASLNTNNLSKLPTNPFVASNLQAEVATSILSDIGPFKVAKAWAIGSALNLISPSVSFAPAFRSMNNSSFYMTSGENVFEKLFNYLTDTSNLVFVAGLLIGTFISSVVLVFSFVGCVVSFGSNDRRQIAIALFAITLVFYFLCITGPIIGPKYRLPIEPILVCFASAGVHSIIERLSKKIMYTENQ